MKTKFLTILLLISAIVFAQDDDGGGSVYFRAGYSLSSVRKIKDSILLSDPYQGFKVGPIVSAQLGKKYGVAFDFGILYERKGYNVLLEDAGEKINLSVSINKIDYLLLNPKVYFSLAKDFKIYAEVGFSISTYFLGKERRTSLLTRKTMVTDIVFKTSDIGKVDKYKKAYEVDGATLWVGTALEYKRFMLGATYSVETMGVPFSDKEKRGNLRTLNIYLAYKFATIF